MVHRAWCSLLHCVALKLHHGAWLSQPGLLECEICHGFLEAVHAGGFWPREEQNWMPVTTMGTVMMLHQKLVGFLWETLSSPVWHVFVDLHSDCLLGLCEGFFESAAFCESSLHLVCCGLPNKHRV